MIYIIIGMIHNRLRLYLHDLASSKIVIIIFILGYFHIFSLP